MLTGQSIELRALEEQDLQLVMSWRNQPEVRRFFLNKSLLSIAGQQRWFAHYLNDHSRQIFIAQKKADHKPVGMIGLYEIDHANHNAEIGSTIVGDRSMWGKGIASEMISLLLEYGFVDLSLQRIYAVALDANLASQRVKEKCGFTKEGILRQAHYTNGRFEDVHLYAIIRKQWVAGLGRELSKRSGGKSNE